MSEKFSHLSSEEFWEDFASVGEGNPLENVELTKEEQLAVDKLSGALDARNERERKELKKKVAHSQFDVLYWKSGLAQRNIEGSLSEAGRHNEEVWLGMLDLDVLKVLNDSYGYNKADKVMYALINSIEDSLRKYDSYFQFGVDEFPLLLVGITQEDLPSVIERISENFESELDELVENGEKHGIPAEMRDICSFSGGFTKARKVADYGDRGVEYETPQELFDRTDAKLHIAKKSGRNTILVEGSDEVYKSRKDLELDLGEVTKGFEERYGN